MSLDDQALNGESGTKQDVTENTAGQTDPTTPAVEGTASPAQTGVSSTKTEEEQATPPDAPAAETPVPAEAATEAPTAAPSTAEPPAASDSAAAESTPAPERKVQLNPQVNAESAKAIPSIAPSAPKTMDTNQPAEEGAAPVASQPASAQSAPSREPVAIPRADELDLDVDLESQIEAAMGGASSDSGQGGSADAQASGLPRDPSELEPGTRLTGTVESVDEEQIVVELGFRSSGILGRRHLAEGDAVPEVGSEIEVMVESVDANEGVIHLILPRSVHRAGGDWNALAVGQTVECTVEKTNKGGLSVMVSQLRGFMPAGQVDTHFVSDLEPFVGQKLTVRVIDVNPKKRNLVVSRKALLQEEQEQNAAEIWDSLTVGEQRTGTVKSVKDYGAFVDIGGVDGLLHVRELSWTRVNHPSDVVKEGEQVEVKVLNIDREKKKISLGMKQLQANPWEYADQKYPKSTVVTGTVKKLADFGAFVEIEPGLEGLIHISELDHKRVGRVSEVVSVGQEVEAKVLEVNKNKKRISLSLKANMAKPQMSPEEQARREADAVEDRRRREEAAKRRETLKGGISEGTGGGLFGNPGDFS
ncbi:30S ribosomal protein S1 [Rubinisphaera margarita]|uniref:30S ribosomal protein S1 n=1 Tax=Rubinisphaera margarita TaxID=2909586 RepID=UPI001EE8F3CD|nr:30S ribosomal protein S1 [Rubinisphaera margarita]MCG6157870.1 30S ribosomal protein S1 [Rubinisphaera margarita]